jgi:hypothetical protein
MERVIDSLRNGANRDLHYRLGDFCMNGIYRSPSPGTPYFEEFYHKNRRRFEPIPLSPKEVAQLVKEVPYDLKRERRCIFDIYGGGRKRKGLLSCISFARNNLAHANRQSSYRNVRREVMKLIEELEWAVKKWGRGIEEAVKEGKMGEPIS